MLNRKELLQRLLAVMPGVSKSAADKGDCVLLKKGRFFSFSKEIHCSLLSGLSSSIEGDIQANRLLKLLRDMPDEGVNITASQGNLFVAGSMGTRKARLAFEAERINTPLIELPKEWQPLSENFSEAVVMVCACTKRKSDWLNECVHVHPNYLEASDNVQMARYKIGSFVQNSVLIRGESLHAMSQLGMTQGAETKSFLHFKNPIGLRMSIRKWAMERYPSFDEFLSQKGQKIILPKSLSDASKRAGNFADEERVFFSFSGKEILIEARSGWGEYSEVRKTKHINKKLSFCVSYRLLSELAKKHNKCEVTQNSLKVEGESYIYATCLEGD